MPDPAEEEDIIIIRRSATVTLLRTIYREHLTKVLGYVAAAAGALSVMDPKLVADTLGPGAVRWALLVTGVLAVVRGHTNRITPKA